MYNKQIKLMVVLRKLYKTFNDSLATDLKRLGISSTDYAILSVLESTGAIPMQKLGEHVSITSGTITYATDRIIKIGLVKKIQDEVDKRKFFIELTKNGSIALKNINSEHLPYLSRVLGGFSDEELDEITGTIKKLGISVQEHM